MLGISVYFKDLDESYIRQAADCGAKYIMTSLHIPEENYDDLDTKLPRFLELIKELDMHLIPDVSIETFRQLGLEANDFKSLKEKGFNTIRLDYGFDDVATLERLLNEFDLVLNASTINRQLLEEMKEASLDFNRISAMHNFYPRRNTGLEKETFIEKNIMFHDYGIKVQAFVCGDDLKRFPLYEGLPTLESHRELHPVIAMIDLMKHCYVDDVLIGDSKAKISTLKAMQVYIEERKIIIPVFLEKDYEYFYNQDLRCRKERSADVVRITTPRSEGIIPFHTQKRDRGSITIDNMLMGRYCGEVEIMKKDFSFDSRINVIGFIHPEYVDIVDEIDSTVTIRFIKL